MQASDYTISIMLRSCVRARWKGSALMLSVEAAGNNEPLSRAPGLQARRGAQDFRRWLRRACSSNECLLYGNVCLFFAGRKSEKELPALAAQPRAFSSLLSLPSQAQSVIKAFRRQGIGSADEFNTARFLLSRLESLSAAPTSLSFLRFRSKSSKSSEGGQMSCLLSSELSAAAIASAHISAQPRQARLCDLFRCAPQIPQTRQSTHQGRGVCSS